MKNNIQQNKAITTLNGPVLIIAGPGTGKTYTLVERVLYMVGENDIDPSTIMITTFTNKAATEILDRLSMKFNENGIIKDTNDMLIGNFHSVCRSIIDEFIEYTNLSKNYINIDNIEQKYLIERYIEKFRKIPGYNLFIDSNKEIYQIQNIINKVCEYGILHRSSNDRKYNTLLKIVELYEKIIEKFNMMDFSHILFYTYKLIKENDDVRKILQSRINYIMVDEYQDTNLVQEKIIFTLLNENKNICVVGDDDQALYRFRGASVKNILEFDKKFDNLTVIKLMHNYRSHDSIIKFYSKYLQDNIDKNEELSNFRYTKLLFSDNISEDKRVVKIVEDSVENWCQKILYTLKELINSDSINSLNEVAIIFSSVNEPRARKLISFLKKNDIDIYIPKTSTLLSRYEIEKLIGALYAVFKPILVKNFSIDRDIKIYLDNAYNNFYKSILKEDSLSDFVSRMSRYIQTESFNIDLYDIVYRLFAYSPFYEYMQNEEKSKSLSRFLELIKSFSLINQIYKIDKNNLNKFLNLYFFSFIDFIKNQSIPEFDEDTIIPKSNTLSVMTIHASKGMEYPVVIMASLWDDVYKTYTNKFNELVEGLVRENTDQKISNEPKRYENILDYYRKNYTGFSRAKDLLILAGIDSDINGISRDYRKVLENVDTYNIKNISIEKREIKENSIKKQYAFTTDIIPYQKNPLEYYYTKKLKFSFPKTKELFYGSIVHESIEYINRKIISNKKIDKKDIEEFVFNNARQKYIQGAIMFNKENVLDAFNEVLRYYDNLESIGIPIESELGINYSTKDYIIVGNVDMIYKKNGHYHIMDFKTGVKPDEKGNHKSIKDYYRQLNLYAYLYKVTKGIEVKSLALYFTKIDSTKHIYEFEYDEEENINTLNLVKETINNIENNKFEFTDVPNSLLRFYFERLKKDIVD